MHILLSDLAQTIGLLLFVAAFAMVLVYALAPSNRRQFDDAAQIPMNDQDTHDAQ